MTTSKDQADEASFVMSRLARECARLDAAEEQASAEEWLEGLALTSAQRHELERRWQAFELRPDEGEPWDAVKRSLLEE